METILIRNEIDCESAIFLAKRISDGMGFNEVEVALISTAVSELSTNIIRFADEGRITLISENDEEGKKKLVIVAEDEGPGIRDLEHALMENATSYEGSLGLGLPSVKRVMDEFQVETQIGKGTRIYISKYLSDETRGAI